MDAVSTIFLALWGFTIILVVVVALPHRFFT
jgi:hypothetical protein